MTSAGLGNRYIHCYILIGPVHQNDIIYLDFISIIPPLPEIANLSMKYFTLSKVNTDKSDIKQLYMYHGLSTCMGDNPLAKARGLSPRTGRQTMV